MIFLFAGFQQVTLKKEDSNLVIILRFSLQKNLKIKRKKHVWTGPKNELCEHSFVTKDGTWGNEGAGKQGSGRSGENYHTDTYTHPTVLQSLSPSPPTNTIPTMTKVILGSKKTTVKLYIIKYWIVQYILFLVLFKSWTSLTRV